MAFVAFPDCIRAEVRFATTDFKPCEFTLWFRKFTGTVTQDDVDEAAEIIDTAVDAELMPLLASAITYTGTYVRDMSAEISYQATVVTNAGVGGVIGTAAEAHSAVLVLRRSGLVGRKANGRIYVPGATATQRASTSQWTAQYAADVASAIQAINTAMGAPAIWAAIVASRSLMVSEQNVLLATFPIEAWVGMTNIAAYRNRSN